MSAVLIVDDSLTVRMDLRDAFVDGGFDATTCCDVATARAALAGGEFALVVLDVLLPDGDGVELLSEIKRSARHAATPIVLLSSEAEVADRVRGLRTGADEYVGKPYDAASLVARAHQLVDARRTADRQAHFRRGPVLVVDDSVTVREELRGELERSGLEAVTAATGEDGLRLAALRRPSAIVVDGAMPGMDGAAFIRHVRSDAALRTTPCILLTASRSVGELSALDAGADAWVRKEEGHAVVLARVQALLRATTAPPDVAVAGVLSPKRLLTVSTVPERLERLADELRREGHEAVGAHGVDEALTFLEADRVDAIVVDAPALEPALEACARVRSSAALRHIPVVLVGDRDDHDVTARAINAGADDYVPSAGGDILRARVRAQLRRKQFEDENRLREGYARSAAILETISDAFFAADREWRLAYVNRAFEELVRVPRRRLVGATLWEAAAPLRVGAFEPELRQAAAGGEPRTFESPFGEERWLEVRAYPHEDGVTAYLRDVTERRRSQEVQAHLLGIVSHDLRTPLTAMTLTVAGALRDRELSDRQRRALTRIGEGAGRMAGLIKDLLDYSQARLGGGLPVRPAPTDLDVVCTGAADAVRAAYPAAQIRYHTDGDGRGEWDAERIHQALVNLLTNAVRYGADGADVTLASQRLADRNVVTVHNVGPPIDPALLGHMFEPFKRGVRGATRGGVGLGLFIVKQIVVAHGGAVAVRSDAAHGTTFEVTLPNEVRAPGVPPRR